MLRPITERCEVPTDLNHLNAKAFDYRLVAIVPHFKVIKFDMEEF